VDKSNNNTFKNKRISNSFLENRLINYYGKRTPQLFTNNDLRQKTISTYKPIIFLLRTKENQTKPTKGRNDHWQYLKMQNAH